MKTSNEILELLRAIPGTELERAGKPEELRRIRSRLGAYAHRNKIKIRTRTLPGRIRFWRDPDTGGQEI